MAILGIEREEEVFVFVLNQIKRERRALALYERKNKNMAAPLVPCTGLF